MEIDSVDKNDSSTKEKVKDKKVVSKRKKVDSQESVQSISVDEKQLKTVEQTLEETTFKVCIWLWLCSMH